MGVGNLAGGLGLEVIGQFIRQAVGLGLEGRLGALGNGGSEQRAFTDPAASLLVPNLPTAQLAGVEPGFEVGGSQRAANAARGLHIL